MIIAKKEHANCYKGIHPRLDKALELLQDDAFIASVGTEKVFIEGDALYAFRNEYSTVPFEETYFEAHQKYLDIQMVVSGQECCGIADPATLGEPFKEKPDLVTAERYIKKKSFFWNAGIFIWNVSTVVNSLRVYQPAISKVFEGLLPYYFTDKEQELINERFPTCENISIDYAIMEKADEIFVFPANFGWSDLGTWGSLHANSRRDAQNNALIGTNIQMYESRNCVVHTTQEKKVVIQGMDGYIVAEKDNTLLVCRLSEEQRIKDFAE